MKKGFTLIELLAVIVILAIIALIATPIVLNIIRDSKDNAQLRSGEMYLDAVETSVATSTLNNKKINNGTYPIMKNGNICLGTLTEDTCSTDILEVEVNGETPESGTITIEGGKIKDIELIYKNNKTIVKNEKGQLVYKEEEKLPEVIQKLLNDNPVEENTTNGLMMMSDDSGDSYYYSGSVGNIIQFGSYEEDYYVYPLNYYTCLDSVCFESSLSSSTDTLSTDVCNEFKGEDYITNPSGGYYYRCGQTLKYSAGTLMYWKIVRINGDGTLRLIYNGTTPTATGSDVIIGYSGYENSQASDPSGSVYNISADIDSFAKISVDAWYTDALSDSSYDKYVTLGNFCSDTSGEVYDTSVMPYYFTYGNVARLTSSPASPVLTCPNTSAAVGGSYNLKAGLITADEVKLSNGNLLDTSTSYWTMTPYGGGSTSALTWYASTTLSYKTSYLMYGIRPVINVDVSNLKITGSGSSVDPYVLSEK